MSRAQPQDKDNNFELLCFVENEYMELSVRINERIEVKFSIVKRKPVWLISKMEKWLKVHMLLIPIQSNVQQQLQPVLIQ